MCMCVSICLCVQLPTEARGVSFHELELQVAVSG